MQEEKGHVCQDEPTSVLVIERYRAHVLFSLLYEQKSQEDADLDEQAVGALSPSLCQHINRFGQDQFDVTQPPPALNYDIQVITSHRKKEK